MSRFVIAVLCLIAWTSGCGSAPEVDAIRAGGPIDSPDIVAQEGDWPWWRGPGGDGKSETSDDPPTVWSSTQNIAWHAEVPGRGHSSPIVCGNRILLTTADEDAQQQLLLCYDRASGKKMWEKIVHDGGFTRLNPKNSHASATPACDGERVLVAFINDDALRVSAYDLDGNLLWQQMAGPFESEHGYGSSVVLYKSLAIVCGDNKSGSFIAALDRETGDIVWRSPRTKTGRHGSYATPAIFTLAGRQQLILTGHDRVISYNPDTGEAIWSCKGPSEVAACTPACDGTLVFASGGYPEKNLLAIRADGSDDVTKSHIEWRSTRGVAYVPSPVVHDGHLYVVSDEGIATCYVAQTGETAWRKRLGGKFSASFVEAGGKLFVPNEAGTVCVLAASPKYQLIAKNKLDSGGFATPVICGGRIYLRTTHRLYCIAKEAEG